MGATQALAATEEPATVSQESLDGVTVEAVEAYPSSNRNEVALGIGLYPFNSYYNSFTFSLGYNYTASRIFTWELFQFTYLYSVEKGLRAGLADRFNVNPQALEKPNYMFSTQAVLMHSYGKFVSFDQKIRYFRSGLLLGGGIVNTSHRSLPTVNAGMRFDMYADKTFDWKFEVKMHYPLTNGGIAETERENPMFVTFMLGGGVSF